MQVSNRNSSKDSHPTLQNAASIMHLQPGAVCGGQQQQPRGAAARLRPPRCQRPPRRAAPGLTASPPRTPRFPPWTPSAVEVGSYLFRRLPRVCVVTARACSRRCHASNDSCKTVKRDVCVLRRHIPRFVGRTCPSNHAVSKTVDRRIRRRQTSQKTPTSAARSSRTVSKTASLSVPHSTRLHLREGHGYRRTSGSTLSTICV